MKKPLLKTIIIVIIACLLFGYSGFKIGVIYSALTQETIEKTKEQRQKDFNIRTDKYIPSCEELTKKDIPSIVKQNNDYFFVHKDKGYFYVVGVNFSPRKKPITSWWGGNLESELKRCSKEK